MTAITDRIAAAYDDAARIARGVARSVCPVCVGMVA